MTRTPMLVLAILAMALLPVFAHAHLASCTPATGSTVKRMPAEIVMSFTEPLEMKFSRFAVVALDVPPDAPVTQQLAAAKALAGTPIDKARRVDRATLPSSGRSLQVRISVDPAAKPGVYAVVWKGLSADGHAVKDALVFKVVP